ncbi:SusC/RagA family TonB-linked outer membrane protein [Ravibacter arvi]|uniref:SusC/RagA family TonB-linked outer membrane protein n=1 Tax=Ravibacter arvi TaxID=2051041 RepID=A0ABP8M841_9BACT
MSKEKQYGPEIARIMRLVLYQVVLWTAFAPAIQAERLHAQRILEQKVTLNLSNVEVEKVLDKIEAQTRVKFMYNPQIFSSQKQTFRFQDEALSEVLQRVLAPHKVVYEVVNARIILRKDTPAAPAVSTDGAQSANLENLTGKVTDESGSGLPGVSVLLKGTQKGTITDTEGRFTLDITAAQRAGGILVFSFVGFTSKEVPVGNETSFSIQLTPESKALNEVVVTAFGMEKKRESLVYSVTEVKGEEFTQAREVNIANALTGKIAGVNATSMASGPGSSSRVVIRGNGSLSGNNQPLYVVNGMPINNRPTTVLDQAQGATTDLGDGISSINPDDIESISVLKGGAAAALYGSQAANGVILITTKKGAKITKGIGIEFNSNFTVGTINIFPDYQYEFGQGSLGVPPKNQGEAISTGRLSFGKRMNPDTLVTQFDGVARPYAPVHVKDNILNFYRPSTNLVNTLSFAGGGDRVTYRMSLSDLNSNSIVKGSGYKRQTANVALKALLSEKLSFDTQIQYNYEEGTNRPGVGYVGTNSAWGVYLLANTVDIRSLAPGYNPETGREVEWQHVNQATNPYFARDRMKNKDNTNRVIAQGSLTYNITPDFFVKGDFMRDFRNWTEEDSYPIGTAFRPLGTYRSLDQVATRSNARIIANYSKTFAERIGFTAMAGGNWERDIIRSNSITGAEFIIPNWISAANLKVSVPGKGYSSLGTNSVFASADLNLDETYFLSLTGRQDKFSTLNPGNNKIFYPSVGGSIILSKALNLPQAINFAKLRGSWAQVGSATVAAYAINQLYGFRTGGHMGTPVQTSSSALSNPNLRPLTSTTSEIGLDAQFFNNRMGIDLTFYQKINTDDIVSTGIAPSSGATSTLLNVGKIRNRGIELLLTFNPVRTNDFSWNVSYNMAINQNRVITLAPGQATGSASLLGKDASTRFGRSYMYAEDGRRVYNSLSRYAQLGPTIPLGIGVPPYTMGFENSFTWKGFNLSALIDGKFGNKFFSQAKQYMWRFGLLKETLPGRDNGLTVTGVDEKGAEFSQTWPARFMSTYYNNDGGYSTNFMIDGSFVKLRSLVLGYTIPAVRLQNVKLTGLQISVVARNLAILYRNSDHFDPEQGIDANDNTQNFAGVMLPKTREVGLNLRLSF